MACLGWWDGVQYRTARVHLRNISTGGALVYSGQEPPDSGKAWLCLAGQHVSQWVRAEVAGVMAEDISNHLIRLTFPEGCPYDVFRSVVWGKPIAGSDIAVPEPPAAFVSEHPSIPPLKDRRPCLAEAHTHSNGTHSAAWGHACQPQQIPQQSSQLNQSEIEEQSKSLGSLLWVISFVVNLVLVFCLGVLVAQNSHNIRAFWSHLGH